MIPCLLVIALALAAATPAAAATEPGFADRDSAIAQLYPGHALNDSASGDLDGDGRPEVVVTLSPPAGEDPADDAALKFRVVVFRTNAGGRLERWIETPSIPECKHGTAARIERRSLFLGCLSWRGSRGSKNIVLEVQFAFRRGTLLLVGDTMESTEDINGPHEATFKSSRNLLTGEIVEQPARGREHRSVDPSIKASAQPLANWPGW